MGRSVQRGMLQIGAVAVLLLAAFALAHAAQAGSTPLTINPLDSPVPQPITLTLDCQTRWNPACRTAAKGTPSVRLYSYFYIDNRYRGPATLTYANVCSRFYLADGPHSAKVYARDARRRTATVGPIAGAIRCDRTRPTVSVGLVTRSGKTSANPRATDARSGIATQAFLVDGVERTWKAHTDLCAQLGLRRGYHSAWVTAKDNAGNSRTTYRYWFYCR